MKKILGILGILALVLSMLIVTSMPVLAAKPTGNLAGAQTVAWKLSAAVMPVPPYGSRDIPGSDTASKLIVNQPNGNTVVTLTGVMNGLNPNTTYTVYLSKGYTPYVETGWSVAGSYVIDLTWEGQHYTEYLLLSQSGSGITGTSLALAGNASPWTIELGSVTGSTIDFLAHFNANTELHAKFSATIAADGSMINGYWADVPPGGTRSGTWATTSGSATKTYTGDAGWPGLFTGTVQPFTFATDANGAGSWHVNLTDADLPGAGPTYKLSVWINEAGATMLVSDTFQVTRG